MFQTSNRLSTIRKAALALTLAAASATAQDLTADVVRSEAAGTVTYTFHVDGPPRGALYLFGATSLSPLPIATAFGPWYLDLSTQFGVGLIALDATGTGKAQMTVRTSLVNEVPVLWQGVMIDPAVNFMFSPWAGCHVKETQGFAGGSGFAGSYSAKNRSYRFAMIGAPRGGKIRIKINGLPVCMVPVDLDSKGGGEFVLPPPGLKKGDKVDVEVSDSATGPWVPYASF